MRSSIFLAVPLMLLLTVLQTAVLPYFPILGLVPQLPFLLAVAWGLLRGPNEGLIWGFIAGFCMDLFTAAPTGGMALTYMLAVLGVSWINQILPTNRFVMPILLAALATLIQQILYYLYLTIFGYNLSITAVTTLLPLALLQGFLVLPFYWGMHLLERTLWPRPVEV